MHNFKKNKRGIEAAGFGLIMGIFLLILAFGLLAPMIPNLFSKIDEKQQISLCRASNEINYGFIEEKTKGLVSGPQVCVTIDKTKGKNQVPTKGYEQTTEGAEAEIREMIKNCWYEWLEGSEENMFHETVWSNGCFTCYSFKVEDKAEGVTFSSLEDSLSQPFFAEDTSDKCADIGGFFEPPFEGNWKEVPSSKAAAEGEKCFIMEEGLGNECENRGGRCSSTGPLDEYPLIYPKWQCPEGSCYVKEDNRYSYTQYLRRNGGDIFFVTPSGEETENINYDSSGLYAISFVSPNGEICYEDGGDVACYAILGGGAAAAGGGVTLIGISRARQIAAAKAIAKIDSEIAELTEGLTKLTASKSSGVIPAGVDPDVHIKNLETEIGAKKIAIELAEKEKAAAAKAVRLTNKIPTQGFRVLGKAGLKHLPYIGVVVGTAAQFGILERAGDAVLNAVTDPITDKVPNFIMVSTLEQAQEAGCTIRYVE